MDEEDSMIHCVHQDSDLKLIEEEKMPPKKNEPAQNGGKLQKKASNVYQRPGVVSSLFHTLSLTGPTLAILSESTQTEFSTCST